MSGSTGSEAVMPAINAHLAAELIVEGEMWPVFVWTIDHPAGRVLVDTGMIDVRPEVDDMAALGAGALALRFHRRGSTAPAPSAARQSPDLDRRPPSSNRPRTHGGRGPLLTPSP